MKRQDISIFLLIILFLCITIYSYFNYNKYFTAFELTLLLSTGYIEFIRNKGNSVSLRLYKNKSLFLKLYVLLLLGSIIEDYIFGITFKGWAFPNYTGFDYLSTVFIGYPAAGLSLMFFTFFLKKEENQASKIRKQKGDVSQLLLSFLLVIAGFVLLFFGTNTWYSLIIVFSGFVLFSEYKLRPKGEGIFNNQKTGKASTLRSVILAAMLIGFLTEGTNLGVYDWKYNNVPFENINLFGISLIILFLGWVALCLYPLYCYKLVKNYRWYSLWPLLHS